MHEVPIDLAKATTMAPSVDDGSAGWTTPGRIPEAAVEAAAKAQYGHDGLAWDDGMVPDWECEDDSLQDSYRTGARAALEAAAPHMLAEAKAEVWDECEATRHLVMMKADGSGLVRVKENPYRITTPYRTEK